MQRVGHSASKDSLRQASLEPDVEVHVYLCTCVHACVYAPVRVCVCICDHVCVYVFVCITVRRHLQRNTLWSIITFVCVFM